MGHVGWAISVRLYWPGWIKSQPPSVERPFLWQRAMYYITTLDPKKVEAVGRSPASVPMPYTSHKHTSIHLSLYSSPCLSLCLPPCLSLYLSLHFFSSVTVFVLTSIAIFVPVSVSVHMPVPVLICTRVLVPVLVPVCVLLHTKWSHVQQQGLCQRLAQQIWQIRQLQNDDV